MNIRRRWLTLALLVSVAALVGCFVPQTLAYITAQSPAVVNTFTAPAFPPEAHQMEVRVHKTVHNLGTESIGPDGFRFVLQNTETSESFTMTTDENGHASAVLPLTNAVLGKTYTYRLSEINDGRENVTYSTQVYTIQITLSVNEDNQIVAAAAMDGQPVQQIIAEFENIYNAGSRPPLTGDDTNPVLYAALMLLSGAGMVILLARRGRVSE